MKALIQEEKSCLQRLVCKIDIGKHATLLTGLLYINYKEWGLDFGQNLVIWCWSVSHLHNSPFCLMNCQKVASKAQEGYKKVIHYLHYRSKSAYAY